MSKCQCIECNPYGESEDDMTDAQRERFEKAFTIPEGVYFDSKSNVYTTTDPVNQWSIAMCLSHKYFGWQAAEAQRQARIDELMAALKDLPWRIEDIAHTLQSRGAGDQRIYGRDEWSVPIVNLNTMLGKVNKAILSAVGEVK